jgi:Na+/melibiose symporter-like transporter
MLLVPAIVKKFGYKKSYLLIGYCLVLTYAALNISKSLNMTLGLMAVNGILGCRCAFGFVYASSFMPKSHLSLLAAIYMGNDGLTTFF